MKEEWRSADIGGSATFTMLTSTSSMNAPRQTAARGIHLRTVRLRSEEVKELPYSGRARPDVPASTAFPA
ncbi:hypothetical protein KNE206_16290 [Kitasatospora sp. NE20-6]